MTKRKLWRIFGPVIIAVLLIVGLFSLPIGNHHSLLTEKKAAVSLSPLVMKNESLKVEALSDKKAHFVPFFGSSEFNRMDRYHPAVMAARYHDYTPFFFGKKGAQSLPQYMNMAMMPKEMKGRKAVFVVSPQWFVKGGIKPGAFQMYNGILQNLMWLRQANPHSRYDRYVAKRIIKLNGADNMTAVYCKRIANGKPLSGLDRAVIGLRINFLKHEDALFSGISLNNNYEARIKPKINQLPSKYNYDALVKQAQRDAKPETSNNRFGINNQFYNNEIKGILLSLKGEQKHFNYTQSVEFSDFQTVLHQFKKTHTNVIFVIQPVNTKWETYTGLPMKMYYQSVAKIKFQLQQQGFNNIVDFSHDGDKPAFMNDTIHIGYAGWVAFDKQVSSFIDHKQPTPHYHINKAFLSKKWQNLKPTQQNLNEFKQTKLNK